MSVRVVPGEIGAKDATTRTALPTVAQPRWPPFERVAETIATPRRRFPPHRHEGVEVLTYVIEGAGTYEFGSRPLDTVVPGSARLLLAPASVSHAINPGKGQTVRWFSAVVSLPPGSTLTPRLLAGESQESPLQPDGTTIRKVVGPGAPVQSAMGLECEDVRFHSAGAAFRKVGHDHVAVCYALSGRGAVDNQPLDGGEAALIDESGGMSLQGQAGFHVVLVKVPRAP
jgi:quercetin 2,3-dioxygenase